jgi:hypothetical protein
MSPRSVYRPLPSPPYSIHTSLLVPRAHRDTAGGLLNPLLEVQLVGQLLCIIQLVGQLLCIMIQLEGVKLGLRDQLSYSIRSSPLVEFGLHGQLPCGIRSSPLVELGLVCCL